MRLDDIPPRTVLLGGLAAGAVLAWILALAGMGGALPARTPGAVATPPVPALPPPVDGPVLGPASQYAATATRPLFATDRRPHPFSLRGDSEAPSGAAQFDLVLTSVLLSPQTNVAIVQKPDGSAGWRVRVGEAPEGHPGWTLVRLEPRRAIFQGPEGQRELALRVFDGKGGTAPTVLSGAAVDPPATFPGPGPVPPPPPAATTAPVGAATRPPPTDASAAPDPAQIEAIRRRIEERRRELRNNAIENSPPQPANLTPAPPTEIR